MDSTEKFYIRNIVLSYLEACLINRDPLKKIQEDIAKKRMTILNAIIEHKPEAEIQAVYAIQNFVNKLEHPPSMQMSEIRSQSGECLNNTLREATYQTCVFIVRTVC
jgi:4-hydroxy-L-threonine phosphate dehydrogenase PdxA